VSVTTRGVRRRVAPLSPANRLRIEKRGADDAARATSGPTAGDTGGGSTGLARRRSVYLP